MAKHMEQLDNFVYKRGLQIDIGLLIIKRSCQN